MLVARGVLVKVNSVLIPGINDAGMVELNREVKARGAFLHNIMPLISDPAHGTISASPASVARRRPSFGRCRTSAATGRT